MVLTIIAVFSWEISFFSNTSKPRRSGTLTRLSLLNSGLPFSVVTSEISNLAALLPISIAASLIYWVWFIKQQQFFLLCQLVVLSVFRCALSFFDRDNYKSQSANALSFLSYRVYKCCSVHCRAILLSHCLKAEC